MRRRLSATDGFSLLEMMIALAIGSIGLLALAQVFPLAGRGLNEARRDTEATLAAQERLEQLKTLSLTDAALTDGAHSETIQIGGADYVRRWVVDDDNPIAGMKKIRMTIRHAAEDTSNVIVIMGVLGRK